MRKINFITSTETLSITLVYVLIFILSKMIGFFLVKNMLKKLNDGKLKYFLLEKIPYCGPYCVIPFTQNVIASWKKHCYCQLVYFEVKSKYIFLLTESDRIKTWLILPKFHKTNVHVASISQ